MNVSLLLIIFFVGALATFLAGDKLAGKVALVFSVGAFAVSVALLNLFNAGQNVDCVGLWMDLPKIYFALKADGLSFAMVLLTTALTPLIVFSAFGKEPKNAAAFYALILLMSCAMTGTFLATDGLLYYIFWEVALIPIYFIALLWGNGDADERRKAVVKFFIYTFAGSLFMLTAFIYMYQRAGSFLIEDLYNMPLTVREQFWIFLAFFLAYAIKIPIIPFHTWQAKVYQKAPTVGTMLLSGIMLKMGLYSVLRWQLPLGRFAAIQFKDVFIGLSIAGVIYGSIVALRQKDLKKLLAYSSLAHVGLIAAGAYALTYDGFKGAVLQMVAHGFAVVGLFFAAEIIERRYQTYTIAEMGGIRIQAPKFASMFMILVLASVALPTTFNFVGEFTLLYGLFQVNLWYAILGGLTIILGAYYMLRAFQHSMLGAKGEKIFADVSINETIVLVLIIAVLFFFGVYPKPLTDLIGPSLQNILTFVYRTN